ncbi:MAG: aromatic ring-hydroxylating oxygenase subunit alpha [bacterium]
MLADRFNLRLSRGQHILNQDIALSPDIEFSEDAERAWTLPAHTYWESSWFSREKSAIFHRGWQCIGHINEVPETGDYMTHTVVDQPVLVIRDQQNQVKAFHNVCKHRAHILLSEERGTLGKHLIACPYHAWSYDLSGALRSAPQCELVSGFDKNEINLDSIKTEIILGFIFINLDPAANALEPQISAGSKRFAVHFDDLESYQLASTTAFDIKGNWKNVGDNLLECYHCHPAHKAFVDLVDMDTYLVETAGIWSWQGGITRPQNVAYRIPDGLSDSQREFITFFVWPNMAFTRFPGSDAMAIFVFDPVAPEITRQRFAIYTPDGTLDQTSQAIADYFSEVLGPEDVSLVENVQKGLHSMSYERGRFMVDSKRSYFSEHAVHHFHSLVLQHMRGHA